MVGSALAGLAGALYAHFTAFIAPDLFTPLITICTFLAVTAGGYTRPAGAIVIAVALIALMHLSPQGLLPERVRHARRPNRTRPNNESP